MCVRHRCDWRVTCQALFTRWAGLAVAATFVVAVAMVHFAEPYRGWWPAIVLVFIGAHFATHGAGRWSVDGWRAK